jgi:hypothetical protein
MLLKQAKHFFPAIAYFPPFSIEAEASKEFCTRFFFIFSLQQQL